MAHNRLSKKAAAFMAAVLAVLVSASILPGSSVRAYAEDRELNGHSYVTENSGYRLYMSEEDLSIVIEDKETGSYMESAIGFDDGKNNASWLGAMRSAVVITMINGNDDTQQADLVNDKVNKKITKKADGFDAELYWTKYRFGFTLSVSLTEEGLVARIPDDSIIEDGPNFFIGTIAIYPYMGNSYLDDKEGYILVPDGNGALIYLDDKESRFKSGFSGMTYGRDAGFEESNVTTLLKDRYNTVSDANKVLAPIFGIAHTDDKIAYLGIVEEGAARATIECIPNGVSVDYNRAFARFILRKTYTQPTSNNSTSGSLHIYEAERSHSDLSVRYIFLSGEDADYSGMARVYRDYLLKRGELNTADTTYKTRVDLLGTERESWFLGTSAVVMTTVEDAGNILSDLEKEGVNNLFVVYKGWQKGGLYDLPISSYSVEGKLGGKSDLTKLIRESAEKGTDIYLYNNALLINPDEKNATFNVVKQINKRRYEEETYKDVYKKILYLIPSRSGQLLDSFVKSYTSKGVSNLALAGISNTLFSYNYSGENHTRFDTKASYADTVAKISADTNLVAEQPFAYLWKDVKAFLDMPLYTSAYIFENESVPFLSMVLSGSIPVYAEYMNFEANKKEFFLKMIESGTYPSFYITKESSAELIYTNSSDIYSSEFDTYRSVIAEYDKAFKEISAKTRGAVIRKHEILDGDRVRVTYSNGVTILIDYDHMSYEVQ